MRDMITYSGEMIIVLAVLLIAVGYTGWSIWRVASGRKSPCDGCELKKNCKKFCDYKEK